MTSNSPWRVVAAPSTHPGVPHRPRARLLGGRATRPAAVTALVVVGMLVPFVLKDDFILGIFTDSLVYVTLALSYDLSVGRVGALSLAHPAFFGAGAYAAAILLEHQPDAPLVLQVLLAVGTAGVLAVVIGIPAFRLSHLTFGMATLGFALIAELVAQNEVRLTNGPLCVAGVSPLQAGPLAGLGMDSAAQQYEIFLVLAVLTGAFVSALVKSRIGRAYIAVREDEPMAMSVGISPKRYRMSAFTTGAAIAGLLGAFYAHYVSVVCPTNLDISYTVNLLVILFLGGVGGFWGIILAAFVFTAIPEILQVDPSIRLIVYGAALLLGISLLPEGFEGLSRRLSRRHWAPKERDA